MMLPPGDDCSHICYQECFCKGKKTLKNYCNNFQGVINYSQISILAWFLETNPLVKKRNGFITELYEVLKTIGMKVCFFVGYSVADHGGCNFEILSTYRNKFMIFCMI